MNEDTGQVLPWEEAFLAALSAGESIRKAAALAGITSSTAYYRRKLHAAFEARWEKALEARNDKPMPIRVAARSTNWKATFLEALAETSNVRASAERVNVPPRTVYRMRRDDPAFAAQWRTALREGYDNLEMEVLGFLRDPQPDRKIDVASALRLLAAHRETVERERAADGGHDQQAVFDSIDQFIEDIRQRREANAPILQEMQARDVAQ